MQSIDTPGDAPSFLSPFEAIGDRFGIDWTEMREAYFSNPDGSEEAFVQRAGVNYKIIARGIDGKLTMAFDIHGHLFAVDGDALEGLLGAEGPLAAPAQTDFSRVSHFSSHDESALPQAGNPMLVPIAALDSEFTEQIWALVDMLFWSLSPVWLGYTDQQEPLDDFQMPALDEADPASVGKSSSALAERLSKMRGH